jgi:hypothetical protein
MTVKVRQLTMLTKLSSKNVFEDFVNYWEESRKIEADLDSNQETVNKERTCYAGTGVMPLARLTYVILMYIFFISVCR